MKPWMWVAIGAGVLLVLYESSAPPAPPPPFTPAAAPLPAAPMMMLIPPPPTPAGSYVANQVRIPVPTQVIPSSGVPVVRPTITVGPDGSVVRSWPTFTLGAAS